MCHKNLAELLGKILRNSELATHWFEDSHINLRTGKCLVNN